MSLNYKVEKLFKVKNYLNKKLLREGLTKREKNILDNVKRLTEDAMSFDPNIIGGARPSRSIQQKIETGQLPLSKFGLTQAQVDFFTSEAFKNSIVKLEKLLGRNSNVSAGLTLANRNLKSDAMTAFRTLSMVVGQLMNELVYLQMQNKVQLEKIATEAVETAMGINREFFSKKLTLDGQFTTGYLSKLKGMRDKIENISDEEIVEKFADIDSEKKQSLEDFLNDIKSTGVEIDEKKAKESFESTFKISPQTVDKAKKEFSDEVSRRMIINMFRRGMSLYFANAYEICKDKIERLPNGRRILEISNVIQPIMLHMYWLFDDIGGTASSGGGQIGQIQVKPPNSSGSDESSEDQPPRVRSQEKPKSSGPFVIQARAATLPLLVHELIKGVIMFFTSAGGKGSLEQQRLVKKASTSLETEAYDLVYSEPFFYEFYKIYYNTLKNILENEIGKEVNDSLVKNESRGLNPFMLKLLSEEKKDTLFKLTKSLFTLGLEDSEFAEDYIENLINNSRELRSKMSQNPSYLKTKKY